MKTYKEIFTYDNLYNGYLKCRRSKRHKTEVIEFELEVGKNLKTLEHKLLTKTYLIDEYKKFMIYDPKKREIQALDFSDRIIQRTFCDNYFMPFLEKHLIYDNGACMKGKGNRVFDHVKGAIKYKGDDNSLSLKAGTINDIRSSGLEVIHVIQRYGMSEETAFEVEAALIDSYPGLTNSVSGHYSSERGIISAYEIEYQTKLSVFDEPKDIKYMIIKTKAWKNNGWASEMENPVYEATRWSWVVSLISVKDYKYVLSVYDSVVVEVFEVESWHERSDSNRKYFTGKLAPESIRSIFKDKRIPDRFTKKGQSNPVLYSHKK